MSIEPTIKETEKKFRVNVNDIEIYANKTTAEEVYNRVPGVELTEVIFLLAAIENGRRISTHDNKKKYWKMEESTLVNGLVNLLQYYEPSNLIDCLEELKYYEIEKVFNSPFVAQELQELL